jgi:hypothetical protein
MVTTNKLKANYIIVAEQIIDHIEEKKSVKLVAWSSIV